MASKQQSTSHAAVSAYLIAYNTLQTIGWSLIGLTMAQSFVGAGPQAPLYELSKGLLNIFQTAAVLEVVHCALGMVRSSVFITAFQVASRIMVVWGVLHPIKDSQQSLGFSLLLIAWTVTEIIRYSYYVLNLAKLEVYPIVWCRYTLFIVLYPIGVAGELLCMYRALPVIGRTGLYALRLPNKYNFSFDYQYALVLIMLAYIPVFPQLYFHMFAQRRKIIGGKQKGE
ncbi:very-long-chain (3R)-3-hydroxyacyl-CoA dehydratase 2-like [Watersipora subatra]|uniref:very-long-chain (3R)-3-hydroxyacyl-CoA dehydratase 2-like n=1 Tax=Watersipora subatra TaxID=2589382 RepID=UPI00355B5A85